MSQPKLNVIPALCPINWVPIQDVKATVNFDSDVFKVNLIFKDNIKQRLSFFSLVVLGFTGLVGQDFSVG